MNMMWCWRCKMDVGMLDEDEYRAIYALYGECIRSVSKQRQEIPKPSLHDLFEPVRQEYERITGMVDCHQNAILHHRIATYGPPCKLCSKPLRTPRARFCAACGWKVGTENEHI